jgi:plastocyanin
MSAKTFLLSAAALALGATQALAQHSGHERGSTQGPPEYSSGAAQHGAASAHRVVEGTVKDGIRIVEVAVTDDGFAPSKIRARKGEKVRFVVTRKTDSTCAKEIVIEDQGIDRPLPLGEAVIVEFTPTKSGEIRYACGMGHVSGIVFIP